MSDQLAAAAAAMGLPETLVQRSAEARAAETGASVEDILAGWAGGEAVSSPSSEASLGDVSQPEAETEGATSADEPAPAETPATPEVVIETPAAPAPPAGPYRPPVLVGVRDNPIAVLAGVVGLFVIVVMVGLIGPSIPADNPGARTSHTQFSEQAQRGQNVYLLTGCGACHTQMVRPVVADVGLGPVTLNDTNQILGTRRFGPDLSDVGSRLTASQIEATITGLGDHPSYQLDTDDLSALVAYLGESAPGGGS